MTTTTAFEKLLKEECNLSNDQIQLIKEALRWYSDEINDIYWRDHIINIVDLYVHILKLKAAAK